MVFMQITRSDGKTFTIDGKKWKLYNEIDGVASVTTELTTTDLIGSPGSILTSKRITSRDITFSIAGRASSKKKLRSELISFFNSYYTFTLHISYLDDVKRKITCELYNVVVPTRSVSNFVVGTITMLALNPYFKSENQYNVYMGLYTPKTGFPYVSKWGKGFNFGVISTVKSIQVINNGDVNAPYKIVTKAKGKVVNPVITQGNNAVKLMTTLNAGDVLTLDFETIPPKIDINGVNSIQLVERNSDFNNMYLNCGSTIFSYDADEGVEFMDSNIYYHELYLGVI